MFSELHGKSYKTKVFSVDCNTPMFKKAIRQIFTEAAAIRRHKKKVGMTIYNELTKEIVAEDIIVVYASKFD